MAIMAFTVPAVGTIQGQTIEEEKPRLPQLKPRLWYRQDRLDARPVAWSLRNHPEEWEWRTEGITLHHKPSGHTFWTANGPWFYGLYEANCSCTSSRRKFQLLQASLVFGPAVRDWERRRVTGEYKPAHFAEHFIH